MPQVNSRRSSRSPRLPSLLTQGKRHHREDKPRAALWSENRQASSARGLLRSSRSDIRFCLLAIGVAGFVLRGPIGDAFGLNLHRTLMLVLWAVATIAVTIAYVHEGDPATSSSPTIAQAVAAAVVGVGLLIWLAVIFLGL